MPAFANSFSPSHKQPYYIQNTLTTFTIPEHHIGENSSYRNLLATTAGKPCTAFADIRHGFSRKHVVGYLLWFRQDNAGCEMPFVSRITLWTFLGSICLMVVSIPSAENNHEGLHNT